MTDNEFMELALREARMADAEGEIPIGAVIVYKGLVIATAHNQCEKLSDPTAHAEVLAIRKACKWLINWRLTGCTLYVTIEPCPMCAGAIMNARPDALVYGASDSLYGAVDSRWHLCEGVNLNHSISVSHGVKACECRKLMDDFFRKNRDR